MSFFLASVLLLVMNFVRTLSKHRLADLQTILTMLWRNSWSIGVKNWHQLSQNTRRKRDKNARNFHFIQSQVWRDQIHNLPRSLMEKNGTFYWLKSDRSTFYKLLHKLNSSKYINYKFMSVRLLTIKISQWARENFAVILTHFPTEDHQ